MDEQKKAGWQTKRRDERKITRKAHQTRASLSIFLPKRIFSERKTIRRPATAKTPSSLPVSLGHALDLVLLLDGVGVGRSAGGVDDLVGEALGDGLDVPEGGLARAGGDQVQSLVHRSMAPKQGKYGTG